MVMIYAIRIDNNYYAWTISSPRTPSRGWQSVLSVRMYTWLINKLVKLSIYDALKSLKYVRATTNNKPTKNVSQAKDRISLRSVYRCRLHLLPT